MLSESAIFRNLCANETFRLALINRIFEYGAEWDDDKIDQLLGNYERTLAEPLDVNMKRYFNSSNDLFYEEDEYIRTFFAERYDYMIIMCQNAFPNDDVEGIAEYYLASAQ